MHVPSQFASVQLLLPAAGIMVYCVRGCHNIPPSAGGGGRGGGGSHRPTDSFQVVCKKKQKILSFFCGNKSYINNENYLKRISNLVIQKGREF